MLDFLGHAQANHIRRVWRLLGVNHQSIVNRRVRGHHGRLGSDFVAISRFDSDPVSLFYMHDAGAGENLSAKIDNRLRHTVQIFQRMKLRLPRKFQHRVRFDLRIRNSIDPGDTR